MRKNMRQRHLFKAVELSTTNQGDCPSYFNPEDNATQNLLLISNEDFDLNINEYPLIADRVEPRFKERNIQTSMTKRRSEIDKKRISVVQHYTQCYKMAHKALSHELISEHEPHLQKNVVNPCNFLLFSDENYNDLKIVEGEQLNIRSPDKLSQKLKQNKTFYSFVKKRNKSYIKKQFMDFSRQSKFQNLSLSKRITPPPPLFHISKSCQIKKKDIEDCPSPMKIVSPVKIDKQHCIEFKCTSPTFPKHRGNYRQLRYRSNIEGLTSNRSTQK